MTRPETPRIRAKVVLAFAGGVVIVGSIGGLLLAAAILGTTVFKPRKDKPMASRTWKLNPSLKHPGWYVLIGPYDKEFKADLKASVPARQREWVPSFNAWRIHEDALVQVQGVIERHTIKDGE